MNRAMLEQTLAEAEEHVVLGERHIARQRDLVAKMERDGSPPPTLRKRDGCWLISRRCSRRISRIAIES